MDATLSHIWRHPIKGIGCEPLSSAALSVNRPIPGDRAWAVLREGQTDTGAWQRCRTFLRGATGPSLMAVDAKTTDSGFQLSHPDRPDIRVDPETGAAQLCDWLRPIWPADKPGPAGLVASPPEGMSDMNYPSISIISRASLNALSDAASTPMDMRRFRCNLWLDGLSPFAEFDLIGKRLTVGTATLEVIERNERCRATEANPETGLRDVDTLKLLRDGWGHQDFGVYARVVSAGDIAVGDTCTLAETDA